MRVPIFLPLFLMLAACQPYEVDCEPMAPAMADQGVDCDPFDYCCSSKGDVVQDCWFEDESGAMYVCASPGNCDAAMEDAAYEWCL